MMRALRTKIRRLRRDTRGAAAVEFALCAPILLVAIMGIFDLGYNMYTASILNGSIQKAARDSTIEGAQSEESKLDGQVEDMILGIAPGAETEFKRTSYATFSNVRRAEDFDDLNGNGTCDEGEPFEDANGNGSWDRDRGKRGFGGARDAVMYEVTITYPRLFPVFTFLGQDKEMTQTVRTVLRNQPYSAQSASNRRGRCA